MHLYPDNDRWEFCGCHEDRHGGSSQSLTDLTDYDVICGPCLVQDHGNCRGWAYPNEGSA